MSETAIERLERAMSTRPEVAEAVTDYMVGRSLIQRGFAALELEWALEGLAKGHAVECFGIRVTTDV